MKNIRFSSFRTLCYLMAFGFFGCKNEATDDLEYGLVPAAQKSILCRSLRMDGQNLDGEMPSGTGLGSAVVVSHPQAVEISAGVLLFIPYSVNDTNKVCKVFLQVEDADNYWETRFTLDPTSRQPYFQILIPKFVRGGNFNLVFSIGDCDGNISPIYSTKTIVSPLVDCNTGVNGSVGITVRSFDMGDKAGNATFSYDHYNIPDRLDIRYNGKWVASTGTPFSNSVIIPDCSGNQDGFVSGSGDLSFAYDPKISRFAEIYVSGCLSGTAWAVQPMCPQ